MCLNRPIDRQTDELDDRKIDLQTDEQTNRETYGQMNMPKSTHPVFLIITTCILMGLSLLLLVLIYSVPKVTIPFHIHE